jgi:CBS domain-containing protein
MEPAMQDASKITDEVFPYRPLRQILARRLPMVHTVAPGDSLTLALQKMAQYDIGLLVVLESGWLVGVISERDMVRRAGKLGTASLDGLQVADLMTRNVITVDPDERFGHCLSLMDRHGTRHLPVVEAGKVLAVISIRDLLHEAVSHHQVVLDEMDLERLSGSQSMH